MHMHFHMSLRCTVQVVTAEDTLHATACVRSCLTLVQLHGGIAAHVSSNAFRRSTRYPGTLTAAVSIVGNRAAIQVHFGVFPDETTLGTAIDVAGNATTVNVHLGPQNGSKVFRRLTC